MEYLFAPFYGFIVIGQSGRELGKRERENGAAKGGFESSATVAKTPPLYRRCMLFQFTHTVLNN